MKNHLPLMIGLFFMMAISMGVGSNLMIILSFFGFIIAFIVFLADLMVQDVDHNDWHLTPFVLTLVGHARYRRRINSDLDPGYFAYEYSDTKTL